MKIDASNRGKPYTDAQLAAILDSAPTQANVTKWARVFNRGRNAIGFIYVCGYASRERLKGMHWEENKFAQQVRRVAKKVGIINL